MSMRALKDKGKLAPFVPYTKSMMDTPAWRAMSNGARVLYLILKRRFNSKKENNGRLYVSTRDAQKEMGGGHRDSISRWFRELEFFGFIRMTTPGSLGVGGKGKAPHWRITEHQGCGREGELDGLTHDGPPAQER